MSTSSTRDPERKVWMVHPVTGGRQVVTALALANDAERQWALREARAEIEAADNRGKVEP